MNPETPGSSKTQSVSTWSNKKLYQTLDKSNDVELLEACHTELYSRKGTTSKTQTSKKNSWTMEDIGIQAGVNEKNQIKYANQDLTGWSSKQLKTAIDTCQDKELLRACRAECNRRSLRYERNLSQLEYKAMEDVEKMFIQQQNNADFYQQPTLEDIYQPLEKNKIEIRCFKVPMTGLVDKIGVWYGQFQGQKLCKEMEIVQQQTPILLSTGKHDAIMSKMDLDSSGLEYKKVEIPLEEFEKEWQKQTSVLFKTYWPHNIYDIPTTKS